MSGSPSDPPSDDRLPTDTLSWASQRVGAILDAAADESGPISIETLLDPGPERRQEPRYSLEEPARVQLDSWAELLELYTKDISHNGIFIQSSSPPEPGTKVGVHLLLPDGSGTIEFQGEVMHVDAGESVVTGFGVRFYGVTDQARNTLQWIVAQAKAVARAQAREPGAVVARPQRPTTSEMKVARAVSKQDAEREECRRLRAVLCDVAARSDMAVLDLSGSPTLEEIDQAFKRLARQYDPQLRGRERSPEAAKLYKQIYFRIDRAYRRVRSATTAPAEAYARALESPTLGTLE